MTLESIILATPRQAACLLTGMIPPQAVVIAAQMVKDAQRVGDKITLTLAR